VTPQVRGLPWRWSCGGGPGVRRRGLVRRRLALRLEFIRPPPAPRKDRRSGLPARSSVRPRLSRGRSLPEGAARPYVDGDRLGGDPLPGCDGQPPIGRGAVAGFLPKRCSSRRRGARGSPSWQATRPTRVEFASSWSPQRSPRANLSDPAGCRSLLDGSGRRGALPSTGRATRYTPRPPAAAVSANRAAQPGSTGARGGWTSDRPRRRVAGVAKGVELAAEHRGGYRSRSTRR
jgi:hypothetical protein